jgi:hypothetical protein
MTPQADNPITDDLLLAALDRAVRHRGYQGASDWAILEQLSITPRSKQGRLAKTRLPELVQAGFLEQGREHGVAQWMLTPKGRKHLSQISEVVVALPESPQHRKWRDARDAAEQEIEGFYLRLRDCMDRTTDLLSMPMPPGASSDAWFEIGERPHKACRRLGSASYCLYEWVEPPEDKADPDDRTDPSDDRYPPDERKRRQARRAGRRNPLWWHDNESASWLG